MKVIFTIDTLAQGGAEQSTLETIKNFSNSVESIVVYFYNDHKLKEAFEQINCKVIYLNISGKYNFFNATKKLVKVFKIEKPDIVVSTLYRANIISRIACKLTKIPVIGTFVTDSYVKERKVLFKGYKIINYYSTWILDCITAWIPNGYISNSKCIGKTNAKALLIPNEKVNVVYRGRETSLFSNWEKPTGTNNFIITAIGRLVDIKLYPLLIRAVHNLKEKFPNLKVIIFGEGPERKKLEHLIQELGIENMVQLAGNQPSAWKNLYHSNAYINTSIYEGFSGALVEAMMVGLPIIVSDIAMNLEAITHNETAIVFESNNIIALESAITTLIEQYENACEYGRAARIKAFEYFDIKVVIKKYEEIINKILLNATK